MRKTILTRLIIRKTLSEIQVTNNTDAIRVELTSTNKGDWIIDGRRY